MHVSASEGVAAIREARGEGIRVYGETLQQYAMFTDQQYKRRDGALFHTYPSLKTAADTEAIWEGLISGTLSTVATDAGMTHRADKLRGRTIVDATGGAEPVESRMAIVFSEGVMKRGLSLDWYADVTSANAARIFGLYPRKGAIAPGSDADLAIIDPSHKRVIRANELHGTDYTVWEGWEVTGWPVTSILRGEVMVNDGQLVGERRGQLLRLGSGQSPRRLPS
jgi:dihydropyrimidinase